MGRPHNHFTRLSDEAHSLLRECSERQETTMAELASDAVIAYLKDGDYRACIAKLHWLARELDMTRRYMRLYLVLSLLVIFAVSLFFFALSV